MYLTIQGLVLRVTDYNDRDSLLTLLTKRHGRLTVKARGLRRKNSPLTAACQLLTYSEFIVFENRNYYTINEAHPIDIFEPLRRDITKLSLATYFAQVAEVLSQEDMPNPELQALVLNCLHALARLPIPEKQVKAVFELRSLCIGGFTPDVQGCCVCGSETPDRFDLTAGTFICSTCIGAEEGLRMPVTPDVLTAVRYIVYCESKRLFSFTMSDENMVLLGNLTEGYLMCQLSQGFSSLDFYKSLVETELY